MANFDSRQTAVYAAAKAAKGNSRSALIIVGVLALLGLAYALIRVDVLRARIVEVHIQLEALQESHRLLSQQVTTLSSSYHDDDSQLAQLRGELAAANDNIEQLRGGAALAQRQSVRSEALYLLRLADDQLQLGHDASGADASLQAAATVLQTASDATLSAVRMQVMQALTQLRAAPGIDAAALDAQLSAAEQQVNSLELAGVTLRDAVQHDTVTEAVGLHRAWQVLKQNLRTLITVSRRDASSQDLLSADEQALRRRHLQLLLLNARLALHVRDQATYASALNDASLWLQQNFAGDSAQVRNTLTSLQHLAMTDIAVAKIDLAAAIKTLTRPTPTATEP